MIDKIQLPPVPIQGLAHNQKLHGSTSVSGNPSQQDTLQPSFEDVLQSQLGRPPTVRLSAHAQRRIVSRNINFGSDEAVRLEQAVEKAASKGSRESLILMDDLALVVNVKNRIVVTAVDANSRKENVFTNIDSVVLT